MEKYEVVITSSTRLDLDAAVAWYESQKEGLGIDFLLEFYEQFIHIKNNPKKYINSFMVNFGGFK